MRQLLLPFALLAVAACGDLPTHRPLSPTEPSLATAVSSSKVDFSITDAGLSLGSDGKGMYRTGVCGVLGTYSSTVMYLAPAGQSIPKSQQASCNGIAPRRATLRLAVRHVSDVPHVDDVASPPGSGTFDVANVKFGFGGAQATTINSNAACGTAGLRFTSATYPGSNNVVREQLAGGVWHMYTQPWPNDKAYCENGGVVTYWHVSLDLTAQVLN